METIVQEHIEAPIAEAKRRGKARTAFFRYREDGTYDSRPLSKTYFSEYYAAHKEPTPCQFCNRVFTHKTGLYKHGFRSKKCQNIREDFRRQQEASSQLA